MGKVYVCNRYPNMAIAFGDKMLQFKNGVLECETDEECAHVESLPSYGVFIVPRDPEESPSGPEEVRGGTESEGGEQSPPRISVSKLGTMRKEELLALAKELGLTQYSAATSRADLILAISEELKKNGGRKQ